MMKKIIQSLYGDQGAALLQHQHVARPEEKKELTDLANGKQAFKALEQALIAFGNEIMVQNHIKKYCDIYNFKLDDKEDREKYYLESNLENDIKTNAHLRNGYVRFKNLLDSALSFQDRVETYLKNPPSLSPRTDYNKLKEKYEEFKKSESHMQLEQYKKYANTNLAKKALVFCEAFKEQNLAPSYVLKGFR